MALFDTAQVLGSMRYKSFTWGYNPAECTYSCQRSYVAHKYPELTGVELEDMDVNEVVITGKGEFFGPDAYSNWMRLNAEFKTFGPGPFYHPVFTDVTYGLMTKLQAQMEPCENYVAYSFEIVSDMTVPSINTPSSIPPASVGPNSAGTTGSQQIKVGSVVILTGYAYYDSYGSSPRSEYKNGVKYTVTYTNYNGSHPIHCGSLGWCRLQDVKLANSATVNAPTNTSDTTYVVKAGDTLSSICLRYGADWRAVAAYNGIKNPNLIYVGQVIKIPKSMQSTARTPVSNASGTKNNPGSRSAVVIDNRSGNITQHNRSQLNQIHMIN